MDIDSYSIIYIKEYEKTYFSNPFTTLYFGLICSKYIIRQETDDLTLLKYAPNGLEEYPKFRLEEKD